MADEDRTSSTAWGAGELESVVGRALSDADQPGPSQEQEAHRLTRCCADYASTSRRHNGEPELSAALEIVRQTTVSFERAHPPARRQSVGRVRAHNLLPVFHPALGRI